MFGVIDNQHSTVCVCVKLTKKKTESITPNGKSLANLYTNTSISHYYHCALIPLTYPMSIFNAVGIFFKLE